MSSRSEKSPDNSRQAILSRLYAQKAQAPDDHIKKLIQKVIDAIENKKPRQ